MNALTRLSLHRAGSLRRYADTFAGKAVAELATLRKFLDRVATG